MKIFNYKTAFFKQSSFRKLLEYSQEETRGWNFQTRKERQRSGLSGPYPPPVTRGRPDTRDRAAAVWELRGGKGAVGPDFCGPALAATLEV